MNHINRLLRKVRERANGNGWHIWGIVEYRPDLKKFTAGGSIWDGVDGSGGEAFYSEHDTEAEACAVIDKIAEKYPGAETLNFIIDDLTFEDAE